MTVVLATQHPLPPQQEKVARLVARGLPCGKIARTLGLSRWTVRHHIKAIALKLHAEEDISYYNTVMLWASHHYRD